MKNLLASLLLLLALQQGASAQYIKENLQLDQAAATQKYSFQHLRLYPIRANNAFRAEHQHLAKYVTLEHALKTKKVVVTEQSAEGNVNSLFMENTSKDTVMVLAGEVVQGGKQDRVIAQDLVLYPRSGKKQVSVYCVEHGRWRPKNDGTAFRQYYNLSSNEVRKAAAVKKDQQEVWNKVAETTEKNRATTSTGTLTALQQSSKLTTDLKAYKEHFQQALSADKSIIGVVAVSGNKVLGCDMFASHGIFQQYLPNLLHSYATEAITSGAKPTAGHAEVQRYLQTILADESKQEEEVGKKGTMLKDGRKKLHISTF